MSLASHLPRASVTSREAKHPFHASVRCLGSSASSLGQMCSESLDHVNLKVNREGESEAFGDLLLTQHVSMIIYRTTM